MEMAELNIISCSNLTSITTFPAYVTTIRKVTADDFSLVSQCKAEVCNALWGSGNPDISGIGMIIGYIIENVLAFVLVLTLYIIRNRLQSPGANLTSSSPRYLKVAIRACSCYQDCATFFAFSTQLACLVILLEYSFDISVTEIGYSTANIAEAVSLLTLLPLIYIAFQSDLLRDNNQTQTTSQMKNDEHTQTLRFGLYVMCWLLSIYPFLSRMYHAFGPKSGELSITESSQIKNLCFTDVDGSARNEVIAMKIFAVSGHVLVSILTVAKLVRPQVKGLLNIHLNSIQIFGRKTPFGALLFILLPAFAASQIWTILRIQGIQKEISVFAGNVDADGKWTFGQIVAVTVFFPVPIQALYGFVYD